jgi:hypothetical protein
MMTSTAAGNGLVLKQTHTNTHSQGLVAAPRRRTVDRPLRTSAALLCAMQCSGICAVATDAFPHSFLHNY